MLLYIWLKYLFLFSLADCFNDPSDPNSSRVMETLSRLQEDVDQDVRYHSQPDKALLEEEQVGVVEVVENNELLLAEK